MDSSSVKNDLQMKTLLSDFKRITQKWESLFEELKNENDV